MKTSQSGIQVAAGREPAVSVELRSLRGAIDNLEESISLLISKLSPALNDSKDDSKDEAASPISTGCEISNLIHQEKGRIIILSRIVNFTTSNLEI